MDKQPTWKLTLSQVLHVSCQNQALLAFTPLPPQWEYTCPPLIEEGRRLKKIMCLFLYIGGVNNDHFKLVSSKFEVTNCIWLSPIRNKKRQIKIAQKVINPSWKPLVRVSYENAMTTTTIATICTLQPSMWHHFRHTCWLFLVFGFWGERCLTYGANHLGPNMVESIENVGPQSQVRHA